MEDQYSMSDLRQFITSRPLFPSIPPPPDLLSAHRGLGPAPHNPYEILMFRSDTNTGTAPTSAVGAAGSSSAAAAACVGFGGFEMDAGGISGGGDGGAGRWPRQETLTLLEIRSRLDHKFKEANQKGPLWDEVSRIMSEEHGYQRSGKKCREKFENLYKYYKKTKEGKAGRQDGKHYRFFRQLEALYGETSNNNQTGATVPETHIAGGGFPYSFPNRSTSLAPEVYPGSKLSDASLSLSNYSGSENATSSDDSEGILDDSDSKKKKKKRRGKSSWKAKIKDFIDSQMKKLIDKQEEWMDKMTRTIEHKEKERIQREEEWRKQDVARMDREHKFWANERAWIEARDAALMDALHKLNGKGRQEEQEPMAAAAEISENQQNDDGSDQTMNNSVKGGEIWPESEITRLVQLRTEMEIRFQGGGISEEAMWDEIANRMACFGYERRSAMMCKDKWDSINDYLIKCNKKRKEINSKSCTTPYYYHHLLNHDQPTSIGGGIDPTIRLNRSSSNNNNNNDNAISGESCFKYFMGDPFGRIID